jgi:hypothetical protein
MKRTNIQVSITKDIKTLGEEKAKLDGFDNFATVLRYFAKNYVNGNIRVGVINEVLSLEQKMALDEKYDKALKDIKDGNFKDFTNADDMVKDLSK